MQLNNIDLTHTKHFAAIKSELTNWPHSAYKALWATGNEDHTYRVLCANADYNITRDLLRLSKTDWSRMVSAITGHTGLLAHL